MQVTNPTNEALEIQYRGTTYSVEAKGTVKNVLDEAAQYWQKELHNFIILEADGAKPASKITTTTTEAAAIEPNFAVTESKETVTKKK